MSRHPTKKVVSVPLEEDLLEAVEKFAASRGIDRVAAMKFMCRAMLMLPAPALVYAKPGRKRGRKKKGEGSAA